MEASWEFPSTSRLWFSLTSKQPWYQTSQLSQIQAKITILPRQQNHTHNTAQKKASGAKLIYLFYFVPLTMSKLWSRLLFQQGWFSFFFLQAMAGPHHYFLTMKANENKILTITHLSLTFPLSLSFFWFSHCQFWLLWKLSYTFNYPQQQRPHKWDQKLSKRWHCGCQLENHLVSLSLSRLSDISWAFLCVRFVMGDNVR